MPGKGLASGNSAEAEEVFEVNVHALGLYVVVVEKHVERGGSAEELGEGGARVAVVRVVLAVGGEGGRAAAERVLRAAVFQPFFAATVVDPAFFGVWKRKKYY